MFFAAFTTAIISAIIGMAGGVTLLSIMTFFMPLSTIIPVHGAVQLVSNTTRCMALKNFILWPVFKWYLLGLPLGTALSAMLLKSFGHQSFAMILVVALIWYVLFKPKKMPAIVLPYWGFGFLAFLIGLLNPFIGATGPLQASFFIRNDWSKEQIVATKATSQALGHILKIPAFLYLGFDYLEPMETIILMSFGVFLGTSVGVKLLKKTSDHAFRILYKVTLFLASLKILYGLFKI